MIRTILAALVLASAPALAIAECSRGHQQAMSCADGMIWDKDSKSCTSATG
ncbi:carbohydrate-binding module family 14 protein [Thalassovita sp.]|uniref:carbohydrate-binding module family 14 protein n=1 Tax=Thalassovita sp. TaxID=1979401 RepID=UPI003B58D34F